MKLLTRTELIGSLDRATDGLFIDPLLRADQIGAISVDLRVGYDFLVSVLTRKSAIHLRESNENNRRGIKTYFQETRRKLGEPFILYPHQLVLTTTAEYLSLPANIYADIRIRSSYSRLGISVGTTLQPGWRGSIPLELFNHGNIPIELIVGSCICQAYFYQVDSEADYMVAAASRKYYGSVRPAVSKADRDSDLNLLAKISQIE